VPSGVRVRPPVWVFFKASFSDGAFWCLFIRNDFAGVFTCGGPVRCATGFVGLKASEQPPVWVFFKASFSDGAFWCLFIRNDFAGVFTCGGPVRCATGFVGLKASEQPPVWVFFKASFSDGAFWCLRTAFKNRYDPHPL
jgi:hypothetical protein